MQNADLWYILNTWTEPLKGQLSTFLLLKDAVG